MFSNMSDAEFYRELRTRLQRNAEMRARGIEPVEYIREQTRAMLAEYSMRGEDRMTCAMEVVHEEDRIRDERNAAMATIAK